MPEAAASGQVVEQYAGGYEGRAAEIETGATRSARELIDDIRSSGNRLMSAWVGLPVMTTPIQPPNDPASHDGVVIADEHDERPWGSYTVLDDAPDHKVKRIVVLPGKRLSYQRHASRSEHWFIVVGLAEVTLDGVRIEHGAGDSIDIPSGAAHRIENVGPDDLVFIEVQHGDYFGEDDIERIEDDFGRAG